MAKLGEIATYINGYAFKPQDWSDEGIPIIRIQDLTGNSYQANRYNGEYASKYEVNDGDVLISWSASLGVYIWHGEKAVLNQHIFKVVFDKERISKDFFVHQVGLILENAASDAHGATMKHLTKPVFDALPFYLPPYEKQCEIAEVLDKVTSLISLRKQQLAKLEELVKARFVEMFGDCHHNPKGWQTKTVEDIAFVGSSKRVFVEELQTDGIPFYRGTEVGALAEKKAIKPELFITEEHYNQLCTMSGKPQKGDLLMPSICPDGRIWIVDTDAPFYFKDGRVLWIHLTSADYNSVFLLYTLKDRIMTDYDSIASGTTFAELKIFSLKKCRVFDAPIALQNEFAAFVERVDKQKQTVQQSLEKLELMKKALMQEYFG
jgi:type I restriction enzyme S subunit